MRRPNKRSQRSNRASLREEMAGALGPEYLTAKLFEETVAEYKAQMREDARRAGYARGHIIKRVMPGGHQVTIVSSTGPDEPVETFFRPDTGQHHNALLASIYHTNMRADLAD